MTAFAVLVDATSLRGLSLRHLNDVVKVTFEFVSVSQRIKGLIVSMPPGE